MSGTTDLVERLRERDMKSWAVDPKAVYRTRPVALFEEAADTLEATRKALATAAASMAVVGLFLIREGYEETATTLIDLAEEARQALGAPDHD